MISRIIEILNNLTPKTKRILVVCIFVTIIAAIAASVYTGSFEKLLEVLVN